MDYAVGNCLEGNTVRFQGHTLQQPKFVGEEARDRGQSPGYACSFCRNTESKEMAQNQRVHRKQLIFSAAKSEAEAQAITEKAQVEM